MLRGGKLRRVDPDLSNYYVAVFRQREYPITGTILLATAVAASFAASGCHSKIAGKSDAPFRVIATDAGFDAPTQCPRDFVILSSKIAAPKFMRACW